ncbi:hypothetical protein B0H16DRAFT_1894217 [Mycena metata]|uniref:Uncharacterized protein n=1 Tax=Mycena metata TaxID=1033252 RepID=A0AAD7MR02_9AGAR|nr:hypothetical protein B0H16DRAFT_1894217 [Mycena metata]
MDQASLSAALKYSFKSSRSQSIHNVRRFELSTSSIQVHNPVINNSKMPTSPSLLLTLWTSIAPLLYGRSVPTMLPVSNRETELRVRLKFVEAVRALLAPEQRDVIEEALEAKFLDPDDKVRAAVCRIYAQLDYGTALHYVKPGQLPALAGHGVDKKQSRTPKWSGSFACSKTACLHWYSENKDKAAILQFAWIPNALFQMLSVTDEIQCEVVAEYILPFPPSTSKNIEVDEVTWTGF